MKKATKTKIAVGSVILVLAAIGITTVATFSKETISNAKAKVYTMKQKWQNRGQKEQEAV